jgi:hypothetical protein
MQLGLERALDSLEHGNTSASNQFPQRSGLIGLLTEEVRKALKS